MFGIGGWEFGMLIILALIVFGPERLPRIAGQIGKAVREFQRQASEMQATFTTAINEAQIQEELKNAKSAVSIQEEIKEVKDTISSTTTLYPALAAPGTDIAASTQSIDTTPPTTDTSAAPATTTELVEYPEYPHPAFPFSEQPPRDDALETFIPSAPAMTIVPAEMHGLAAHEPAVESETAVAQETADTLPSNNGSASATAPAPAQEERDARQPDYII